MGSSLDRDSYTGEVWKPPYISKIPDIHRGKESFYRRKELLRISQQYWVSPADTGWRIHRRGCPAALFPILPEQQAAVRAMDWMVRNDASVEIALHWLNKKDLDPFFRLLDYIMEAANGKN